MMTDILALIGSLALLAVFVLLFVFMAAEWFRGLLR